MLKRSIKPILDDALKYFPAILLSGARQIGKSTLVMQEDLREYVVMDDITQRNLALQDPQGYIKNFSSQVTIDEIQKTPNLLESIKLDIDHKRINGKFLLTGSANVLNFKNSHDSLAGRIIELTMWPLSAKEKQNKPNENVCDMLFDNLDDLNILECKSDLMIEYIIEGGYPLSTQSNSVKNRTLWINAYISSYIERDIRSIGDLRNINNFIIFFNILVPQTTGLLNLTTLQNSANLNKSTIDNYIGLLENVYQIHRLNAYYENISKRFSKSPKLYMTDSGVFAHILKVHTKDQLMNSTYKGAIIETFVLGEFIKHISYSSNQIDIYHYRTNDKKEIDFILKSNDKIIACEVKSANSITKSDFKHIVDFQSNSNNEVVGIVLYFGEKKVKFGKNLYALPMSIFF